MYKEMYSGDGTWLFVDIEEYTRDGVKGHDVSLVKIEDLEEFGPDVVSNSGAYYASVASWWPIEDVKRDDRIAVANSCGYFQRNDTPLLPDDALYVKERRNLCGWDSDLAARMGITPELLDNEERALRIWAEASIERRAEMLMSYYGGDAAGYGDGCYTTLADAMDATGVPRAALSDVKEYDDTSKLTDGWGEECSVIGCLADHIYPRARHAQIAARQMQAYWQADKHEDAEGMQIHLATLVKFVTHDTGDVPEWYAGRGVYTDEYMALMPDYEVTA